MRLVWVVVVELVDWRHAVSAPDGPGCRLVLDSDCVEMRETGAFGGNVGLELSFWPSLQDMIRREGATIAVMGWNTFNARRLELPGCG